ncbi:hypothetical protein XELAEV_18047486mg [Xenopus laevis]|uniref:Uncharacterized protein n=1 Tax=Xenopus laevis TaxID=8355 RepID=A0A974BVH1_XENLA|nr:hypothetical protein XELAEV_18047486mg [Xenopus laevis]
MSFSERIIENSVSKNDQNSDNFQPHDIKDKITVNGNTKGQSKNAFNAVHNQSSTPIVFRLDMPNESTSQDLPNDCDTIVGAS